EGVRDLRASTDCSHSIERYDDARAGRLRRIVVPEGGVRLVVEGPIGAGEVDDGVATLPLHSQRSAAVSDAARGTRRPLPGWIYEAERVGRALRQQADHVTGRASPDLELRPGNEVIVVEGPNGPPAEEEQGHREDTRP